MSAPRVWYFLLGLALLAAAVGGVALRPGQHVAAAGPRIDLNAMVPAQIGDWKIDTQAVQLVVDPQTQALVDQTYSQTLGRTYVNAKGERVMLSIAYGDQTESMRVHKPEVCYSANGFRILRLENGSLDTGFGSIPIKRVLAAQGVRVEPVSYWVTVGDTVASSGLQWKLAQLKYGLTGRIADGMIFRVSSLGDEAQAYPLQENFVRVLLRAMTPEARKRLIGGVS